MAPARSDLRLLRGEDDADRLFFEPALAMESDTEMGRVPKNTLDAIGPLWRCATLARRRPCAGAAQGVGRAWLTSAPVSAL